MSESVQKDVPQSGRSCSAGWGRLRTSQTTVGTFELGIHTKNSWESLGVTVRVNRGAP